MNPSTRLSDVRWAIAAVILVSCARPTPAPPNRPQPVRVLFTEAAPRSARAAAELQLAPLERVQSRGLRPSQQVGQTIVLPLDTDLVPGDERELVLRSSARGHAFGQLDRESNRVVVEGWQILGSPTNVAFRASDRELAQQAAWDIWVRCRPAERSDDGTTTAIALVPDGDGETFASLIAQYELDPTPYLRSSDVLFTGRVGRAHNPDLGEHLAAYQPTPHLPGYAPPLHELFLLGFRGPYFPTGSERPGWAFKAVAGFDPPLGSVVALRLPADPRGHPVVRVDRVGRLVGPPWTLLLGVRELLRRAVDADQDVRITVVPRLDGHRVVFDPIDGKPVDDEGPWWALMEDFEFRARTHRPDHNPLAFGDRPALLPEGRHSDPDLRPLEGPYTPHPGALIAVGFGPPELVASSE